VVVAGALLGAATGAVATMPCGSSVSMYRVPSAVFTLSKSEKDCSWPMPADTCTASASCDEPVVGVAAAVGSDPDPRRAVFALRSEHRTVGGTVAATDTATAVPATTSERTIFYGPGVVGVVVIVAGALLGAATGAVATVPCGSSVSVYRVPSAVFTSVTGVFTFSVSVAPPVAYEPPATATFAVEAVSATSWNTGLAAGKFDPVVTGSLTPLIEMTAEVGGAVGGAGGTFGGLLVVEPPPEELPDGDFVPVAAELGPPVLNGSLLSKSEKDCSWPMPADTCTASTSCDEPVVGVAAAVGSGPLRVGAVGSGVAALGAATGAAAVAAATGFDAVPPPELSPIIVCTA
jgi:hypothetical protein